MKNFTYGIEIETVGQTRELVARAIQTVVGGGVTVAAGDTWTVRAADGRLWQAMRDGSLSQERSAEIVSPILRYEDLGTLQDVVRAVRAAGAKVDLSCGLHVHIGADRFGTQGLVNLAKLVHQQEDLIVEALAIQPTRLIRYTRKLPTSFVEMIEREKPRTHDDLNRLWYGRQNRNPSRYDQSRYFGLNLNSVFYRGTLEFRWFEGSLHAGQVKAYVQFCLALCAKALNAKSAASRKRKISRASGRYDFRVFLLRLGMIGDEFKTARHHLLANLAGSSAWKHGDPTPATAASAPAAA